MPNKRIEKTADAYRVSIFICGDYDEAVQHCRDFVDAVGLCVTVTPKAYCYTGGMQNGVEVGLINYARFPRDKEEVWNRGCQLADYLLTMLNQGSYTIQDEENSLFVSIRDEDQ